MSESEDTSQSSCSTSSLENGCWPNPDPEWIKIKFEGPILKPIDFIAEITTPMGELTRFYSEEVGVPLRLLQFRCKGRPFLDDNKLYQFKMKRVDVINVYMRKEFGIFDTRDDSKKNTTNSEYTIIKFRWPDTSIHNLITHKNVPMKQLRETFCIKIGIALLDCRFHYNGHCFSGEDTPEQLGIQNGDEIDVIELDNDESSILFNNDEIADLDSVPCFGCSNVEKNNADAEYINIKFHMIDTNKIMDFTAKSDTVMVELIKHYCERVCTIPESLVFRFEGCIIYDRATLAELNLRNNEVIYIRKRSGYSACRNCRNSNKYNANSKYITISFRGIAKDKGIDFIVKVTTPMSELIKAYSDRVGIPLHYLRFWFDRKKVLDHNSPSQLQMQNGDIIDVDRRLKISPCLKNNATQSTTNSESIQQISLGIKRKLEATPEKINSGNINIRIFLVGNALKSGTYPDDMDYKITKMTRMGELKKLCSDRTGLPVTSLRFIIDQQWIDDDKTPMQLGLNNDDNIYAYLTPDSVTCYMCIDPNIKNTQYINLKIFGMDGTETDVMLRRTTKAGELKKFYSHKMKIPAKLLMLFYGGNWINDDKTLKQLKMKNNDVVYAFRMQGDKKCPLYNNLEENYENSEYGYFKFLNFKAIDTEFVLKKNTEISEIKEAYGAKLGVNFTAIRFFHNGRQLRDSETIMKVNVENGDEILVVFGQGPPVCADCHEKHRLS